MPRFEGTDIVKLEELQLGMPMNFTGQLQFE